MKKSLQIHAGEQGQATLEVMLILPLAMGVLFLALAVAVLWHAQALSAHLSLEGASRDGAASGSGAAFASGKKDSVAPSFSIFPVVRVVSAGTEGENEAFSMNGIASIPWAPFGLKLDTIVNTTVVSPIWKFQP